MADDFDPGDLLRVLRMRAIARALAIPLLGASLVGFVVLSRRRRA